MSTDSISKKHHSVTKTVRVRYNKCYLLQKEEKRVGGKGKEEKKNKEKKEISFYSLETREALMSPSRRDRSLLSLRSGDGKRLRSRGDGEGAGGGEFDRFTCQVKTQRPRITRLYFRDMPSVGRYANRGLLSSIDTLSVDRFEVLLLIRQSRSRPEKKSARVSLFGRRLPVLE